MTATAISTGNADEDKRKEKQARIEQLKREMLQPISKRDARRGSVAFSLTQNNMSSEIAQFRKKQMTMQDKVGKAPAKLDPNSSMRRLSITD